MTSVLATDLIAQGATCSLCGQGFSSANPPTVSEVGGVLYGVLLLIKQSVDYLHSQNDIMLEVV